MAILELSGVVKRFGGLPAVDDVTLTVDEGEIVALVGPNGAGKSTLLKIIGGMLPPSGGTIRFRGIDVASHAAHRARRAGIAMVLQTPRPFATMTVRENAMIGAMFGGERIGAADASGRADEMLEFVGLAGRSRDPVGNLNLHEQRLLEVARQLGGAPRLILLDEVMAGLNDTELATSIAMVSRARADLGVTVIWVEHVMKAVMSLAERVVVLNYGRLIADGSPADVMRMPDVITAYLGESGAIAS